MPGKKGNLKDFVNPQPKNVDTMVDCVWRLWRKRCKGFFAEANKKAKDCFERLENQLDSIKITLDQHSKDLDSRLKITFSTSMYEVSRI